MTTIATVTPWVRKLVPYIADADRPRIFTPVLARNRLARSHLPWTTLSAAWDLMVSMPVNASISVALRIAPAW